MIKPTPPIYSTTLSKDDVIEQKMRLLANFMINRILEDKSNKVSKKVPQNAIIKISSSRNDGTQI